jgi:hypothetical protein
VLTKKTEEQPSKAISKPLETLPQKALPKPSISNKLNVKKEATQKSDMKKEKSLPTSQKPTAEMSKKPIVDQKVELKKKTASDLTEMNIKKEKELSLNVHSSRDQSDLTGTLNFLNLNQLKNLLLNSIS